MLAWDKSLFYLINRDCSNRFLDVFMRCLTFLGSWEFLFLAGIILFFSGKKEVRRFSLLLLVSLVVSYSIIFILKSWIARPRPGEVLSGISLLSYDKGFSFPSGHATNAFLAATLLFLHCRRLSFLYAVALGVAFSRVYLGAHFPSDVLVGALTGIALGYAMNRIAKFRG